MARLSDISPVVRRYGAWKFTRRLYAEINDDDVFTNAAAMAYAWMFAVFPFMIFVLTLIPYLPENMRQTGLDLTRQMLAGSVTPDGAETIMQNVGQVVNQPQGKLLSFGLLLTLFAASGGMNATMSALDQAFDTVKGRSYIWKRVVAMMLTIFMCCCLIIIIVTIPIGTMLTRLVSEYGDQAPAWARELVGGSSGVLLTAARYIVGLTVMQILIGVIYHFGRSRRERWIRFFTPGSILAAVGWIGTGLGMRFYVENFANYSATYGAVAGMVIMLMVFYVNAVIILVGAEVDSEIEGCVKELNARPASPA